MIASILFWTVISGVTCVLSLLKFDSSHDAGPHGQGADLGSGVDRTRSSMGDSHEPTKPAKSHKKPIGLRPLPLLGSFAVLVLALYFLHQAVPSVRSLTVKISPHHLIPLGLLVLGFVVVIEGVHRVRMGWSVEDWPRTTAKVLSSTLRYNRGGRHSLGSYEPEVTYQYEVGGELFSSKRISFGTNHSFSKAEAEDRMACYPVGRCVPVSYNPRNPGTAALEPGGLGSGLLLMCLGVGLIPLAVSVFESMKRGG